MTEWLHLLEKEMATHSSVLAWRIPRTGEPGGLLFMGSQSWTRLKWLSSSSGCDGITVELFKTQRMMQSICCIQYFSKSGRPSSGHRSRKGQSSFQFPKRVVLKNVLTIGQLHVRLCLKSCMLGCSIMWTTNLQMSKMGLEKEEEPEINKLPTSNYQHLLDHRES